MIKDSEVENGVVAENHDNSDTLNNNMAMWDSVVREKLNQGLYENIDKAYHQSHIYHGAGGYQMVGTNAMKKVIRDFRAGFSDLYIENDIFGSGDRAVNHFRITGTHDGLWEGLEPTGKQIDVTGISINRFDNGKMVEEWEFWDEMTLLKQLGVISKDDNPQSILALVKSLST